MPRFLHVRRVQDISEHALNEQQTTYISKKNIERSLSRIISNCVASRTSTSVTWHSTTLSLRIYFRNELCWFLKSFAVFLLSDGKRIVRACRNGNCWRNSIPFRNLLKFPNKLDFIGNQYKNENRR